MSYFLGLKKKWGRGLKSQLTPSWKAEARCHRPEKARLNGSLPPPHWCPRLRRKPLSAAQSFLVSTVSGPCMAKTSGMQWPEGFPGTHCRTHKLLVLQREKSHRTLNFQGQIRLLKPCQGQYARVPPWGNEGHNWTPPCLAGWINQMRKKWRAD